MNEINDPFHAIGGIIEDLKGLARSDGGDVAESMVEILAGIMATARAIGIDPWDVAVAAIAKVRKATLLVVRNPTDGLVVHEALPFNIRDDQGGIKGVCVITDTGVHLHVCGDPGGRDVATLCRVAGDLTMMLWPVAGQGKPMLVGMEEAAPRSLESPPVVPADHDRLHDAKYGQFMELWAAGKHDAAIDMLCRSHPVLTATVIVMGSHDRSLAATDCNMIANMLSSRCFAPAPGSD